jgi:aerobic-type carbon monoxide dehydrogenase small subunit (CoxS/CutS family)
MVITLSDLLRRHCGHDLTAAEVRNALDGHLCRCTGYAAIITATLAAHR